MLLDMNGKYFISLIILLLIPLVSAETTFFDSEEFFISSPLSLEGIEPITCGTFLSSSLMLIAIFSVLMIFVFVAYSLYPWDLTNVDVNWLIKIFIAIMIAVVFIGIIATQLEAICI